MYLVNSNLTDGITQIILYPRPMDLAHNFINCVILYLSKDKYKLVGYTNRGSKIKMKYNTFEHYIKLI